MPLRQESSASQEDEAFDQHAAPILVRGRTGLCGVHKGFYPWWDMTSRSLTSVVWDNWSKIPLPFHPIWKFSAGWIEVPACEHDFLKT